MAVHNQEIASLFNEMADLLEISGANPFRVRAYRQGARTIEDLGQSLNAMVKAGEDLTELPGIGKGLADEIQGIVDTGHSADLDALRAELPEGIGELLTIPGLGPKRVKVMIDELGITSVADVKEAAEQGRVSELSGFGAKLQEQILESILSNQDKQRRYLRAAVAPYVDELLAYIDRDAPVDQLAVAGSYRRAKDTVGDIDILAVATDAAPVMECFVAYDDVEKVLAHGATKSSIQLRMGVQVDLRVVPSESFGAALHYFTGSKAHNIEMRRRAQKKKLKLSEYGLFKGDEQVAGKTEEDVFDRLDLPYIQPELREDRGEFDAASAGSLPDLVSVRDIRGDLHMHTTASDGAHSIREMAEAARERGYTYIAITDHSKRLTVAHGLDEKRLARQIDEIDRLNGKLKGICVLKGCEVDILEDGKLDLDDSILSKLDIVIGSVHSKFNLDRDKQTERIMRAMDNRYFTMLGHPTGRLLLSRDPYDLDMERLVTHAAERGCCLELNANVQRLDLNDVHCRMARDAGVTMAVNTDAHRIEHLAMIEYGMGQARRGWLEKKHVLNTCTLKQLKSRLAKITGK